MKKTGSLLVALALVAMIPSYTYGKPACEARATKQINNADDSAWFQGLQTPVIHVHNRRGDDANEGTFADPVATIERAVELAEEGSLLYIYATKEMHVLENPVVLPKGCRMVGSGTALKVGRKQIPALTKESPKIQLRTPADRAAITIHGRASRVTGLDIVGAGIETAVAYAAESQKTRKTKGSDRLISRIDGLRIQNVRTADQATIFL